MPDEQWFGVRITGLPWIWTIGACTGEIIAMSIMGLFIIVAYLWYMRNRH